MLGHRLRRAAGSFRLVDTIECTTNIPITAAPTQAGDLMVCLFSGYKIGSTPADTLTGWTLITSAAASAATDYYRSMAFYRVCAGGETDTSYTDMVLDGRNFLFRAGSAITGVQATPSTDWTAQVTTGDPTLQTIAASGETGPLISLAHMWGDTAAASSEFVTNSPAFDQTWASTNNNGKEGLTVYDYGEAGAGMTVDAADRGYMTGLISGFLVPQF